MSSGVRVLFNGVRGSTPCAGEAYARYGGHSSCVALEADGAPPILFDLGTGLRPYGLDCGSGNPKSPDGEFHGAVLLSHLHWDHVQGLPFFTPLHREGATLDVYGPRQDDGPLGEVFARDDAAAVLPDHARASSRATCGSTTPARTTSRSVCAKVRSRWVRHVGPTLGLPGRLERRVGRVHPRPRTGLQSRAIPTTTCRTEMLELCDGVDVLIHDAQLTPEEYGPKRHWGHCTIDYAVHVAREAGARRLVLFHHDPAHGDDDLDRILSARRRTTRHACRRPEVIAAYEGLELELSPARAAPAMSPAQLHVLPPDPATYRTVLGHFATGPDGRHRDGRRRAGRHGVQLVHLGVARSAARVVLRGEVVDDVAAHPAGAEVGGEHPRRGRRGDLPAVRGEGRRSLRAHRVHRGPQRCADPRATRSRSSTARRSPSTTPAIT